MPDTATPPFDPTAPKELPKPGPRRPLTKHEYAELFLAQMGKCFNCAVRLAKGNVVDEHMVPRETLPAETCDDLENRQLFCKPCAKAKTVGDQALIAHGRHVRGETGQRARREKRGHGLIKSRPFAPAANGGKRMQSRPFAKKLRRKMNGTVLKVGQ